MDKADESSLNQLRSQLSTVVVCEEYVMPDMLDLKVMNEHGEVRFAAVECEGEGAKGRRGAQQSLRKCCGAEMSRPSASFS